MRVKKDATPGVGSQGNADAIPTATQVGGGKPSDGQVTIKMEILLRNQSMFIF